MSLPKSRILTNKQGLTAAAEFHNNSPEQNTVVNVNVHQPSTEKIESIERPQTPSLAPALPTTNEANPYSSLSI